MSSKLHAAALGGLMAIVAPASAIGWDYPGHRIVGAIADLVLEKHHKETHKRVHALLDRSGEPRSLSQVAVFPDCAKRNNIPFCGRPPSDEEKSYSDRNEHHDRYHFTDVPLQQPTYELGKAGTRDNDIVQMIAYSVGQLRSSVGPQPRPPAPPPKDKVDLLDAEAIWLLAHLVGDIHQPLHVGKRYYAADCQTPIDPNTAGPEAIIVQTQGGNLFNLAAAFPAVAPSPNLHLYWDAGAVSRAMRAAGLADSEQEFARVLAATPPAGWETSGPPETWATEWASEIMPLAVQAHELLTFRKDSAQAFPTGAVSCTWTVAVDLPYQEWAKEHARTQLAKAGFRLAALLKAIFDP